MQNPLPTLSRCLVALFILLFNLSYSSASAQIWGMTTEGGSDELGVIFRTNASGTSKSVIHHFTSENSASSPAETNLLLASDGLFYGVLATGGSEDKGLLFVFDPLTNSFSKKHDFNGLDGEFPNSPLIEASNGKIYGTTGYGGDYSHGGVFEYNPITDSLTLIVHFNGIGGVSGAAQGVTEGDDGKLYGLRYYSSSSYNGAIFCVDPVAKTYVEKYVFNTFNDGTNPTGMLFKTSDGKFYGTAGSRGLHNSGTIFKYDPETNMYTKKIDLTGTNGAYPRGYFTPHPNGKLYGVTQSGGSYIGVLFEYDTVANVYQKRADFTSGIRPSVNVVVAENGKIYGLTSEGGSSALGTFYEFDLTTDSLNYKVHFNGENGNTPYCGVSMGPDGKVYGMTSGGGVGNAGVIFSFDTTVGEFEIVSNFSPAPLGGSPYGTITDGGNGKLYGLTSAGGEYGFGLLFEINPQTNEFVKKIDFNKQNGKNPYGTLMRSSKGMLYGTTKYGGNDNQGVLFAYNPISNTISTLKSFIEEEGRFPQGNIMEASNGKLYGLTSSGGTSGAGVLFEYDTTTAIYTKKIDFDYTTGGSPQGSLVEFSNGKLYGMTYEGGQENGGVIFEYDLATGAFEKKLDLSPETGYNPVGSLLLASNGKIYGVLPEGGLNGSGVLFEYAPLTNTLNVKFHFNEQVMGRPGGTLIQSSNGRLYGIASAANENGAGAIFEYNLITNTVNKISDFSLSTGGPIVQNHLAFIKSDQVINFPLVTAGDLRKRFFTLDASATSGLAINYESSDLEVASINGDTLTLNKPGTVVITASQSGNAEYNTALSVDQEVTIVLSAPIALTAGNVSATGFTAKWTESNMGDSSLLEVSEDNFVTFLEGYSQKALATLSDTITGLVENTYYQYRVRAVSGLDTSAYSNVITVRAATPPPPPPPAPDAPQTLSASSITTSGFIANWDSVANATSYELDISADNFLTYLDGFEAKAVEMLADTVTGLKANTTYKYRVRAVNENGTSINSNVILVNTLALIVPILNPPLAQDATEISQVAFTALWDTVATATAYELEVSKDHFLTSSIKITSANTEVITGLSADTEYQYRVRATNEDTVSVYSNVISISTLAKLDQTISFNVIVDQIMGSDSLLLIANATSGMPVVFTSGSQKVAISVNNFITFLRPGKVSISADQAGNEIYNAAETVTQTFCIKPAKPAVKTENGVALHLQTNASEGVQWYLDGVPVEGAIDSLLDVHGNGVYSVQVNVENCSSHPSDDVSILITDYEEYSFSGVEFYPSPVKEKLYVRVPESFNVARVNILAANGYETGTTAEGSKELELDVHKLAPGLYFLQITSGKNRVVQKFIKH